MIDLKQSSKLLLLGGGPTMRNVILKTLTCGFSVRVLTSIRHAQEIVNGLTFEDFLKDLDVPAFITTSLKSEELLQFCPDIDDRIAISIGAPWIISHDLIAQFFSSRLLNLHGTGLPKNRGGGGFSWQILNSNRFGFCTLHIVDAGIDTGPIVAQEEFLYPVSCRLPSDYEDVYVQKSSDFLFEFLSRIRHDSLCIKSKQQADELSTYWPRLNTDVNGWVDWTLGVRELETFICAFDDPYKGAVTTLKNIQIHIKKASLNFNDGIFHSYQSGLIYRKSTSWICVAGIGGNLIIEQVLSSTGEDLFQIPKVGDRFVTSHERVDSAKYRAIYGPNGLAP